MTHTTSGSNRYMVINTGASTLLASAQTINSPTYNSVTATNAQNQVVTGGSRVMCAVAPLANPTVGSNTATANISAVLDGNKQVTLVVTSYTGAQSGSTPDSSGQNTAPTSTTTNFAVSTTVVGSNCWLSGSATEDGGAIAGAATAGSGTTYRGSVQFNCFGADSNGTVGTGSQSLNWTRTAATPGNIVGTIVSFAPAGGTVNSGFLIFM